MAENENAVVEETSVQPKAQPEIQPENQTAQPDGGEAPQRESFGAKCKEWFRKQIVSLKRAPQRIAFVVLAISTIVYLCCLDSVSHAVYLFQGIEWAGFAMFVSTLLSILVLVLFLNSFPKRKKPNVVFIALTFAFMAAIIGMDILYYVMFFTRVDISAANGEYVQGALTATLIHIILMGISVVLLATLPLYSKLINKINTRKEIESTEMKEEIDTSEE